MLHCKECTIEKNLDATNLVIKGTCEYCDSYTDCYGTPPGMPDFNKMREKLLNKDKVEGTLNALMIKEHIQMVKLLGQYQEFFTEMKFISPDIISMSDRQMYANTNELLKKIIGRS